MAIALAILGSFTLVEAVGGYFANSIAPLAEAAHMLADSASLLLAILAIRVGRRPADTQRTYGHLSTCVNFNRLLRADRPTSGDALGL